jgi:FlaA1/EpsC-like NDP-sugar epimerase
VTIRIVQHYWQLHLATLAVIEGVIFFLAPYAAALLRFDTSLAEVEGGPLGPILPRAILFAGVLFLSMTATGLYNSRQRSRLAGMLARVAASVLGGTFFVAVIFYLFPELHIGRGALLLSAIFAFAGAVIVRTLFELVIDQSLFKRRVLVYGAGHRAASIARLRRRSDRRGFSVIGYVPAEGDDLTAGVPAENRIDSGRDLLKLCTAERADEIVVAMDDRRAGFPMNELLECRLEGVEIVELVTFLERETGKVRLDILNPSWMIFSEGFRQGRVHTSLERSFDVLASLTLLVLAAPLMLLTIIAIKLSEGPRASIFYRQVRVGQ